MNRLISGISTIAVTGLVACALAGGALAGGKSKSCHHCGSEKHVKQTCRLVKTCEDVDVPSYVYTKEQVFYPDKGSVCYTGYRSDTFYDFWRTYSCLEEEDPSQQSPPLHLSHLHCSSYTICGCKSLFGAKPTGCHSGCSIRVPGKSRRITTPILKWETVPLCKDCCEKTK